MATVSPMILGLISSYREGRLLDGAVRSLRSCCDAIRVLEGPVGSVSPSPTIRQLEGATIGTGLWDSDADKRNTLLAWSRRFEKKGEPLWGIMLDGDEILLNGEWLPDHLARLRFNEGVVGGFKILVCELDGSLAKASHKVILLDLIDRYLLSGNQIMLRESNVPVALPLVPVTKEEWWTERAESPNLYIFPPLPGEPHILHRSGLRPPERNKLRLHKTEGEWFEEKLTNLGLPAGL